MHPRIDEELEGFCINPELDVSLRNLHPRQRIRLWVIISNLKDRFQDHFIGIDGLYLVVVKKRIDPQWIDRESAHLSIDNELLQMTGDELYKFFEFWLKMVDIE